MRLPTTRFRRPRPFLLHGLATLLLALTLGPLSSQGQDNVYWIDLALDRIERANLDGTNVEVIIPSLYARDGVAFDAASGKIYLTDEIGRIQRANLDGSNPEDLVTDLTSPLGLALDLVRGKMYWVDRRGFGAGKVQRANLDGTNVEDVATGLSNPFHVAVDATGEKVYWTDFNLLSGEGTIQRANLDGTNVEDILIDGGGRPLGLALDLINGKLYWTDAVNDAIRRADLDGANPEDLINGLDTPGGIAVHVTGGIALGADPNLNGASDKLYWVDTGSGSIRRANLDGTNVEDVVTGLDADAVADLALDLTNEHIYWADSGTDKVQRSNLDGTNVEDLDTGILDLALDLALDLIHGKLYWINAGANKIQRSNLDGTNVEDLITGLNGLGGIALDAAGGKMYWTAGQGVNDKIQRANLDGTTVEDLVVENIPNPSAIALDAANGKMYWVDVNNIISRADLDGANVEELTRPTGPIAIALDRANGKMYWTARPFGNDKIQRANLDGTNVEDVVVMASSASPEGIGVDDVAGKVYWADSGTQTIRRADLSGGNVEDIVTGLERPDGLALALASALPVELTTFEALLNGPEVLLRWHTASETNNAGFEVQHAAPVGTRRAVSLPWSELAFMEGHGTTPEPQSYTFRVRDLAAGTHRFRLKQLDFDGTVSYSPEVEVVVDLPEAFVLTAPFPNPFNPEARFSLMVRRGQRVEVAVYNALGRRVRVLYTGALAAGQARAFVVGAGDLPSGLYVVRAVGETFIATRRVMLLR